MPRIRSIKPEFPQSETIGRLSRDARLLFVLLWTVADDEGRTRAASRMLASLLYPYDSDAPELIESWLQELERENCIVRYEVDGATYLQIVNWLKHQKIDRPSKSKLPVVSEGSRIIARDSRSLDADLGKEREREKDQERKKDASAPFGAHSGELDLPHGEIANRLHKALSADPETDLFRRGREVLGDKAGGMIAQLLKAKDGNVPLARAAIETAATKERPREYIGAIVRGKIEETKLRGAIL